MAVDPTGWLDIILRYGTTFGAGGLVGAVGTKWAEWGVTQRTMTRESRVKKVEAWRKLLGTLPPQQNWIENQKKFMASPDFLSLEPHLSSELLSKMRTDRTVYLGGDFPRRDINKEIGEIEKRWGLV